jgi:hypothetical protein
MRRFIGLRTVVMRLGKLRFAALVLLVAVTCLSALFAQPSLGQLVDLDESAASTTPQLAPDGDELDPAALTDHPLHPALRYARVRSDYIQNNLRDFECLLVKRERINGRLRDYEYILTRARLEQVEGDEVVVPFSVYMHFLAPEEVKGRKALYIEGQNEDKVLIRNGGRRFSYITIKLDPRGDAVLRESRYPITELSLEHMARLIIDKVEADMRADPTGENTEVTFFLGAKVNNRACTHFHVIHPQRAEGLSFYMASIYVDDELQVPIRIEGYDWPDDSGDPVLLEEYTFTQLQLNVGLTDASFATSLVGR